MRPVPIESDDAGELPRQRVRELREACANPGLFRAFYDAALPRVYGYLLDRCGGDPAVAEELTQETFIAVVRDRERFDGRSDVVTWVTAIGRHKLADHFRHLDREERRRLRLTVRELSTGRDAAPWEAVEVREAVVGSLAGLPAAQRAVLLLHYADGLPVREVADLLGRSESATESLMTRAREGFRSRYEGHERG